MGWYRLLKDHVFTPNYYAGPDGKVIDSEQVQTKIKQAQNESPENKDILNLLQKYKYSGELSDTDMLLLQKNAIIKGAQGDMRLQKISDSIDQQLGKKNHKEFETLLQVPRIEKTNKLLHSMSKIDTFSVTVTLAMGFVAVGWLYPKIKGLIAKSTRAAFAFVTIGLALILFLVR